MFYGMRVHKRIFHESYLECPVSAELNDCFLMENSTFYQPNTKRTTSQIGVKILELHIFTRFHCNYFGFQIIIINLTIILIEILIVN